MRVPGDTTAMPEPQERAVDGGVENGASRVWAWCPHTRSAPRRTRRESRGLAAAQQAHEQCLPLSEPRRSESGSAGHARRRLASSMRTRWTRRRATPLDVPAQADERAREARRVVRRCTHQRVPCRTSRESRCVTRGEAGCVRPPIAAAARLCGRLPTGSVAAACYPIPTGDRTRPPPRARRARSRTSPRGVPIGEASPRAARCDPCARNTMSANSGTPLTPSRASAFDARVRVDSLTRIQSPS